jgi:hypothetical protein
LNQLPRPLSLSQAPRSSGDASDCDHCGQTLSDCDTQLRENGATCCAACLMADGHGVVHDEYHNLARRVAGMDKVVAQLVTDDILIRSELTNHQVEPLLRRLEVLEDQVAKLQHEVEHVPPAERQIVLDGFVAGMRETADGMSKRLRILEACIQGIEAKLKLRRKDDPDKVIEELESANVVAPPTRKPPPPPQGMTDEETRRRWWHRNKDDEYGW